MSRHLDNKQKIYRALATVAQCPSAQLETELASLAEPDCGWFVSHPVNALQGIEAAATYWRDLKHAIDGLERRDFIVVAGESGDADYVACAGHLQGNFVRDWLGIPATGQVVHLRYGEIHRIHEGRLRQSYVLVDLPDLMRQAGVWPLAPSLGQEGQWPGPAPCDGLRLSDHDAKQGASSVAVMKQMHEALLDYDGKSLDSMDHGRFWTEHFMWYGPSGIGTTRGLDAFRAHHQGPFLRAFPDRGLGPEYICIGDGPYAATGGWNAMRATHTGPGWLGLPPTGRELTLRVMDFYRVSGGLLAENWVPIDILHILHQLGLDVLERLPLRHGRASPGQLARD